MKNDTKHAIDNSSKAWIKVVLCLWCIAFIVMFAKNSDASEAPYKTHHIIEGKAAEISLIDDVKQTLKQTEIRVSEKALTRDVHQQQKLAKKSLAKSKLTGNISVRSAVHDFTIFEAFSQLYDDFDSDGFYQTFSITFDADVETYGGHDDAYVYAEIYLSRNGGPWEYFYTTDSFTIFGNSTDDAYEVLSNLDSGYPTDYYDVLIDLYEVGYSGIVASYSGDDSGSLYALSLESDEYDQDDYYEYHEHGGSTGLLALMLLLPIFCYRALKETNN